MMMSNYLEIMYESLAVIGFKVSTSNLYSRTEQKIRELSSDSLICRYRFRSGTSEGRYMGLFLP
jgi:hypothetical protein